MYRFNNVAKAPLANRQIALMIAALLIFRLLLYALVTWRFAGLPDAMCRWDCGWYLSIVDDGYMRGLWAAHDFQANWAFFPVFPSLLRIATFTLGGQDNLAGFLTANIFFVIFVAFAVIYYRQKREGGADAALILFLFAYSYGFYFSVPYTESTYAALTMIFFVIARSRVWEASIVASALAATRLTGVLFTPIIVMRQLDYVYKAFVAGGRQAAASALLDSALPIAMAPLGLFLYMLYLYMHTGDAFAFVHIQSAWGRTSHNPLLVVWNGLAWPDLADMYAKRKECGFFSALCGAASIAMSVRLLFIKRYAESFLLMSSTLLALSAGLGSIPRYLLASPIFVVSLFDLLWQTRCRKYFGWIICGFLILELYLVHIWALGYVSLI